MEFQDKIKVIMEYDVVCVKNEYVLIIDKNFSYSQKDNKKNIEITVLKLVKDETGITKDKIELCNIVVDSTVGVSGVPNQKSAEFKSRLLNILIKEKFKL